MKSDKNQITFAKTIIPGTPGTVVDNLIKSYDPEAITRQENLLAVWMIAPMLVITAISGYIAYFFVNPRQISFIIMSTEFLICAVGIVYISYLDFREIIKRHFIALFISLSLIAAYYVYYDEITINYWMIAIVFVIPTMVSTKRTILYYITIVISALGIYTMFFRPIQSVVIDENYYISTTIIMTVILAEFIIINIIFHRISDYKFKLFENTIQQKEEITSLYEELMASEEELKQNNIHIKNQNAELYEMAYNDKLTGLPNKDHITLHINTTQDLVNSVDSELASYNLVYIDLDNFKKINDSLGHEIGDKLLIAVKDRFLDLLHKKDILGRLGGDEFALVIKRDIEPHHITVYLEKMLRILDTPFIIDKYEMNISASFGVATYPLDAGTSEALIQAADTALSKAKENGRNNIQFYKSDMKSSIQDKLHLENNLKRALEMNELLLVYQPLVDAKTQITSSFEALLRWNSRSLGVIGSFKFIPIMEDLGLIHEVGLWVIKQACDKIIEYDLPVSVNVSAIQIRRLDFIDNVKEILANSKASPDKLVFELTESVFLKDLARASEMLSELKHIGIKISIDDFGTGYSSFKYLSDLPVDYIKIDKSFIDNIDDSIKRQDIVASIIHMAHKLQIKVVAEGVEHASQLQYLQSTECDTIQGYYYSKPIEEQSIADFLKQKLPIKA